MDDLQNILVPIFICVILPVSIVLICAMSKNASEKQKANILITAIEANNDVDADKLAETLKNPQKTDRRILNARLLRGCIFSFLGIGGLIYGIYYQVTDPGSCIQDISYLIAVVCIAIGLGFLVTYFVTRKQVNASQE